MNRLTDLLNRIHIGEPLTYANMAVYPLHLQNGHQRTYRTLEEALEAHELEVTEISEGGFVPSLKVTNKGDLPVLLVVGEELIGAKQNRVLNTSLLVPARSETAIPVSCVERGRWSYRSQSFSSEKTSSHLRLRKAQTENVTSSLRMKAEYDANQSAVWSEVERKIRSHDSQSTTSALHDVYRQNEEQLQAYLAAFPPQSAQGMMVVINGEVVGADLFDHAETMQNLWQKLVRGYALDALEHQRPETPPLPDDTRPFLQQITQAAEEIYDSVGLGKDIRLSSDHVTGSSLFWDDHLIHASLFSTRV